MSAKSEDNIVELTNDFYEDVAGIFINSKFIECLQRNFGHKNFRKNQWEIISSIIKKKIDNCAIMPTGYGKSLCYQFPSVFLDTVTLIVSPLISLMEDQVLSLQLLNIKACLLGTAQKDKSILQKVMNSEYTLVYLTPEFITSEIGIKLLEALASKLSLIAIDEAHCISKWGHDFRKSFYDLGCIRKKFPNIPILAMTATATECVRNDIIKSLHLKNPQIVCTGFDRPNLEFNVRCKSADIWNDIGEIIKQSAEKSGSIIVYCLSRNSTEEVAGVIKNHNFACESYHAGISITSRKEIHKKFVCDEIQIIVATIAFGMGIDKPDVRYVIHYGVCQDIESYYQGVGRAGRDGMPAECFLFYNLKDFDFHKFMRAQNGISEENKRNLEKLTDKMYEFVSTAECRRLFILRYFEGDDAKCPRGLKNCCDNCKKNINKTMKSSISVRYQNLDANGYYDFTKDAELLLRAIEIFDGYTGLNIPILFLRGSKDKRLLEKYYSNPLYGTGKEKSNEWWKNVGELLIMNKYIEKKEQKSKHEVSFVTFIICLSQSSRSWLSNSIKTPIKLKLPENMYHFLKLEKTESVDNLKVNFKPQLLEFEYQNNIKINNTQELMKLLHRTRTSLSSKLDVMPYMIVSTKALHQLADKRPSSIEDLKMCEIDGLSEVKIKEFGPHFVECILNFEKKLTPSVNDVREKNDMEKSIKNCLKLHPLIGIKLLTEIHFKIFEYWEKGKDLKEISQIVGVTETSVINYMLELIKWGYCATKNDLKRLGISTSNFNVITSRLSLNNMNDMIDIDIINKSCPSHITKNMIKYVFAYHKIRYHLKSLKFDFIDPDIISNKIEGNLEILVENAFKNQQDFKPEKSSTNLDDNWDNWESDFEIDYKKIDEEVKKANDSFLHNKNYDKKDNNCKTSIENMKPNNENPISTHEENKAECNVNEFKPVSLKRKISFIIRKNKTIIEDSDDENDDSKVNQDNDEKTIKKRNIPAWLSSP